MRVEWSSHAVSDLKQISEYIETDRSLEIANRIARVIYDSVQSLISMPNRGRLGRITGTRELVLQGLPYIIFRPRADTEHRSRRAEVALR